MITKTVRTIARGLAASCALTAGLAAADPLAKPAPNPTPAPAAKEPAAKSQAAPAAATGAADKSQPQQRFMLLATDRVVVGVVEKTENGHALKRSGGTIFYPESQVTYVGQSLAELYEFKVQRVPRNDIPEHLKISNWCMANGLDNEMRAELELIVKLDPSHAEANRRLRILERKVDPKDESGPRQFRPVPAHSREIIQATIRGHGQETFDQFVKVEKLLLNKCARCHAATRYQGDFKLFRRAAGQATSQAQTAKNLQSCLNTIDKRDTHRSPLLYMSVNAHGPLTVPPYGGINDPSYKELRDWVYRMVDTWAMDDSLVHAPPKREKPGKKHDKPERSPAKNAVAKKSAKQDEFGEGRAVAQSDKRTSRPEMPVRTPGNAPVAPTALQGTADDCAEQLPTARVRSPKSNTAPAIDNKIPDPFDPAEFNKSAPAPRDKEPAIDDSGESESKELRQWERPASGARPKSKPQAKFKPQLRVDDPQLSLRRSVKRSQTQGKEESSQVQDEAHEPTRHQTKDRTRDRAESTPRTGRGRRDPSVVTANRVLECVQTLQRADGDPRSRAFAAERLANFGPQARSALPDLEKFRNDSDPQVRDAVLKAMVAIGGPSANTAPSE